MIKKIDDGEEKEEEEEEEEEQKVKVLSYPFNASLTLLQLESIFG